MSARAKRTDRALVGRFQVAVFKLLTHTGCVLLAGVYADCTAPYILGWFGFVGGLIMWYYANDAHQRGLAVI